MTPSPPSASFSTLPPRIICVHPEGRCTHLGGNAGGPGKVVHDLLWPQSLVVDVLGGCGRKEDPTTYGSLHKADTLAQDSHT